MRPGPGEQRYRIRIDGRELEELKKLTWAMTEAFGLDRRIERYRGKRPIGFYRWDLDCLVDALGAALTDSREYPVQSDPAYQALERLHGRLTSLRKRAYADLDTSGREGENVEGEEL